TTPLKPTEGLNGAPKPTLFRVIVVDASSQDILIERLNPRWDDLAGTWGRQLPTPNQRGDDSGRKA
ncbi:MAG: hypothetical protein ABSD96_09795, partial [Candidatus Korobacteraceae bacterium]